MLRRALPTACLLAALALVTGCAGAKTTSSSIPESASLAPADALVYATVTTDEGSDQWKKAASLLERIPGARDGLSGSVGSALDQQGIDWADDVRPALGPELVVVATAAKEPIVLVKPDDEQKLDQLVAKSDTTIVRGTVDGWQALAQSQAALDAYRSALAKGTLEGVDAFTQGFAVLPSEALARVWVDTARLSKDLGQLVEQASSEVDLGLDWLAAAVSAEDDGALLTLGMRTPGGADTRYEPTLFRRVPADAVAAFSFGGTQGLLDRVQGNVDMDEVSSTVQKLTGVSLKGLVDALSGEGALYVRKGEGKVPEVTLVLRPPDPSKTWETVDQLARKLAEQAGTTVTVRTENGDRGAPRHVPGGDGLLRTPPRRHDHRDHRRRRDSDVPGGRAEAGRQRGVQARRRRRRHGGEDARLPVRRRRRRASAGRAGRRDGATRRERRDLLGRLVHPRGNERR